MLADLPIQKGDRLDDDLIPDNKRVGPQGILSNLLDWDTPYQTTSPTSVTPTRWATSQLTATNSREPSAALTICGPGRRAAMASSGSPATHPKFTAKKCDGWVDQVEGRIDRPYEGTVAGQN